VTGGAKRPGALPPPLPSPEEWVAITLSAAKATIGNRRTVVWSRARPRGGVQPPRTPPPHCSQRAPAGLLQLLGNRNLAVGTGSPTRCALRDRLCRGLLFRFGFAYAALSKGVGQNRSRHRQKMCQYIRDWNGRSHANCTGGVVCLRLLQSC
jgi:hypothetical protein